jgi:nucleotide-binding universal stress UspA family protein
MSVATNSFSGFKKILFTTDFSDPSKQAFSYALSMAKNYNAKLIILNVVDTTMDAAGFYLPHISFDNLDKEMESAAMKLMEKSYNKSLSTFKKYEYVVLRGSIHKEIIKYSNKEKADLVVMGTYGHSGIDSLIFGSTTEKVLRKAKCPVLTVYPK